VLIPQNIFKPLWDVFFMTVMDAQRCIQAMLGEQEKKLSECWQTSSNWNVRMGLLFILLSSAHDKALKSTTRKNVSIQIQLVSVSTTEQTSSLNILFNKPQSPHKEEESAGMNGAVTHKTWPYHWCHFYPSHAVAVMIHRGHIFCEHSHCP